MPQPLPGVSFEKGSFWGLDALPSDKTIGSHCTAYFAEHQELVFKDYLFGLEAEIARLDGTMKVANLLVLKNGGRVAKQINIVQNEYGQIIAAVYFFTI
jgi:hypothetical protein